MLILVGVTINLAANGGLFEKSRTASKDTEQKKILEELIAMAEFDNDGKIDVSSLTEKVEEKYVGSNYDTNSSKLTVKGNKGDFYYKVTDTEIKIWEDNNGENDDKQQETIKIGPDATVALSEDGVLTVSGTGSIWTGDYYNEDGNIIYPIMMKKFNENENVAILAMLFVSGAESYNDIKANIGSSLDEATITQIESLTQINEVIVETGITEIGCSSFLGFGDNVILLQLPETITKIEEGALDKAKIKKILILSKSLDGISIEDSDISSSYNQGTDENGNIIFTHI